MVGDSGVANGAFLVTTCNKGKKVWASGFWQELVAALDIVNMPTVAPQAYDAWFRRPGDSTIRD